MVMARSRAAGGKSMVDVPVDHHTHPPHTVTDNSLALESGQIMRSLHTSGDPLDDRE